jgi:DNA-3-methyladenine glycosylase I
MASETARAAGKGNDGLARCPWALGSDDYIAYHDEEWGRPVHGDAALYERLTLEGFQSGLSWLTILRKRPAFRRAFAGFDPDVVATFDDSDVERLMADSSIVRNRRKIESTVANARALVALRMNEGDGALDRLIWSYAADGAAPETVDDVPAQTADSKALAKALKRYDFGFVGPTTCYAAMQACGVVNDHLAGCAFRH